MSAAPSSSSLRTTWQDRPQTPLRRFVRTETASAAVLHDLLLDHQDALDAKDLMRYAQEIGLDTERFKRDMLAHAGLAKVAADQDSADLSEVSGTPTFFINGRRHHEAYDPDTLAAAVRHARARAYLSGVTS